MLLPRRSARAPHDTPSPVPETDSDFDCVSCQSDFPDSSDAYIYGEEVKSNLEELSFPDTFSDSDYMDCHSTFSDFDGPDTDRHNFQLNNEDSESHVKHSNENVRPVTITSAPSAPLPMVNGGGDLTGTRGRTSFPSPTSPPSPPGRGGASGTEFSKLSTASADQARKCKVTASRNGHISNIILLVAGVSAEALAVIAALAARRIQKRQRMQVLYHISQWRHLNEIDHDRLFGPGNGNGLIAE